MCTIGNARNARNSASSRTTAEDSNQNRRGMVLPFAPLAVAFDDIRYSVDMPPVLSLDRLHYLYNSM